MTEFERKEHWLEYTGAVAAAHEAERERLYPRVVEFAEASWPHIEGMLQHVGQDTTTAGVELDGIQLVLLYAPLMFDVEALDHLEKWLEINRAVVKYWSTDLFEGLTQARDTLRRAHRLWDHIERHEPCAFASLEERFSSDEFDWQRAVSIWQSMQIVRCRTESGARIVRLGAWADQRIAAKCPHCGTKAPMPRAAVLSPTSCPRCTQSGVFVMVSRS